MPSKPVSEVDAKIERGEIVLSPNRLNQWGTPCGATTRHNHDNNGGTCQLVAGHGTDHKGQGRCKFHGGATPRTHGRYSTLKLNAVSTLLEEHLADDRPLDLLPDLAAARALFENYINNYEEMQEAMKAWYATYKVGVDGPRPAKIPDMDDARKMLDSIAGIVAKVEKIQSENTITRSDVLRLMNEMGRIVNSTVSDEEEKELIQRRWGEIRLA